MVDYKELYSKLFRETTKAIEILENAQRECEELYINSDTKPQLIKYVKPNQK